MKNRTILFAAGFFVLACIAGSIIQVALVPPEKRSAQATTQQPSAPATIAAPATATNTPAKTKPGIGTLIHVGTWDITVSHAEQQKKIASGLLFGSEYEAKGIWQIVHLQIVNRSNQTSPISASDFAIMDSRGNMYDASPPDSKGYSRHLKINEPGEAYPPNVPAEIALVFDIDPQATGLKLLVKPTAQTIVLGKE